MVKLLVLTQIIFGNHDSISQIYNQYDLIFWESHLEKSLSMETSAVFPTSEQPS